MDKDDLIAAYFSNTLSADKQREFDDFMVTDTNFAEEVLFQKNLKAVIVKEEQNAVKKQLIGFDQLADLNTPKSKSYTKWLVAASITLLLAIPCYFLFTNQTVDNDRLFAENFEPYRNVIQPIIRSSPEKDIRTKAFIAYETENFKDALTYFDDLLNQKENDTLFFYKANTLLKLNQPEEAINILEQNLTESDYFIDKHQWYLALAYLKTNNTERSKQLLKELIASKSSYKNEAAKQLLEMLD